MKIDYEQRARVWAEDHGIVNYRVKGSTLIYNVSYNAYLSNPRRTYQFTVDLNTGKCSREGILLKKFDEKGLLNRH